MTTRTGDHTTGPDGLPELRITRTLDCAAAELWEAVTRPPILEQWFGTTRLTEDHFGQFEVTSGPMAGVTGMVLACQPPHTYQVTWDDPSAPPSKLQVEVLEASQGCELVLTQRGISSSQAADHQSRWTEPLDRLATYAERGPASLR